MSPTALSIKGYRAACVNGRPARPNISPLDTPPPPSSHPVPLVHPQRMPWQLQSLETSTIFIVLRHGVSRSNCPGAPKLCPHSLPQMLYSCSCKCYARAPLPCLNSSFKSRLIRQKPTQSAKADSFGKRRLIRQRPTTAPSESEIQKASRDTACLAFRRTAPVLAQTFVVWSIGAC